MKVAFVTIISSFSNDSISRPEGATTKYGMYQLKYVVLHFMNFYNFSNYVNQVSLDRPEGINKM